MAVLQAKLEVLTSQMEKLITAVRALEELEPVVAELQRKKEGIETKSRRLTGLLEQARLESAWSASRAPNLSVVQTPTPPCREPKHLRKFLATLMGW